MLTPTGICLLLDRLRQESTEFLSEVEAHATVRMGIGSTQDQCLYTSIMNACRAIKAERGPDGGQSARLDADSRGSDMVGM
jgi:hypothetical protein